VAARAAQPALVKFLVEKLESTAFSRYL